MDYRYRFNNRRFLTGADRVPDSFSLLGVRVTVRGESKCHRALPTPPVCCPPGPLVSGEGQPASKYQSFGERRGANRRQRRVLWSAAKGKPPANDSPLISGKGQPAGNWQSFGQRKGAIRRQMAVLWAAARGNPPANGSPMVSGKGQPAVKWQFFGQRQVATRRQKECSRMVSGKRQPAGN